VRELVELFGCQVTRFAEFVFVGTLHDTRSMGFSRHFHHADHIANSIKTEQIANVETCSGDRFDN